jgi:hypothetical protein
VTGHTAAKVRSKGRELDVSVLYLDYIEQDGGGNWWPGNRPAWGLNGRGLASFDGELPSHLWRTK